MKRFNSFFIVFLFAANTVYAKDYNASLFGIRSDGVTLNTRSIQFAIEYIHKQGGGRLVFYVGRYLTGSVHLMSGVTLHLEEGAVLVGSVNPFDYDRDGLIGLIMANGANNIAITGKGLVDGRGRELANNYTRNVQNGLIADSLKSDRAAERAMLIYFRNCRNVTVKNITLKDASFWVQTYDQCKNVSIDGITVNSKAFWNNDGLDIVDSDSVTVTNNYIDASDDGICLKSHDEKSFCNNILLQNNIIRSSASGIKFGTFGVGGFRNIKIVNNTVYDTYRSAIALESVDGGFLEDVLVDGLRSIHTGNVIFIRLGKRRAGRKSLLRRVTIKNIVADVPAGKPDAGYEYEGPVEDMPRNISPVVIAGLPGQYIEDISISGIQITYPGGGDKLFADLPLAKLGSIPELAGKYPEFSMFGELPAWGIYARHAKNIRLTDISMRVLKKEDRVPIVFDDVQNAVLQHVSAGAGTRQLCYAANSAGIVVK